MLALPVQTPASAFGASRRDNGGWFRNRSGASQSFDDTAVLRIDADTHFLPVAASGRASRVWVKCRNAARFFQGRG